MKLSILGTRGIPAQHGGFETFTEHFAVYLQHRGWDITVYCQEDGRGEIYEDKWQGVRRIHIPVQQAGAIGTMVFDWKSTLHAVKSKIPVLTLGYNTAIFCIFYRLLGVKNIINMDGLEWRRGKWSALERAWLYINEKLGAWLANHLIADHPEIKCHLSNFVSSNKITTIPYGADQLKEADKTLLRPFSLEINRYALLIARPERENSILEIVKSYSRAIRGMPLIVLGNYSPEANRYHRLVMDSAGDEVQFVGAIYDKEVVQALRYYARFYAHGHTVGGTNPSLVEALGAGSPVLAHNNKFNRWVAGVGSMYFATEEECARHIDILIEDDSVVASMRQHSFQQMKSNFEREIIHRSYERLFLDTFSTTCLLPDHG